VLLVLVSRLVSLLSLVVGYNGPAWRARNKICGGITTGLLMEGRIKQCRGQESKKIPCFSSSILLRLFVSQIIWTAEGIDKSIENPLRFFSSTRTGLQQRQPRSAAHKHASLCSRLIKCSDDLVVPTSQGSTCISSIGAGDWIFYESDPGSLT
jgi:hypothetical protein